MAFVPGYEHDIFVSYAHVDDEPTVGADKGWVTTLIDGLKTGLNQKLGRKDAFSLWMDHGLSRHESFSSEIENSLRSTAIYLVILSPGYLESEWCAREREVFLDSFSEKAQGGARIFLIERERIDKADKPGAFHDLLGYRFWVDDREGRPPRTLGVPNPDSRDHTYFDLINDLGYDLAKLLKSLKQEGPAETSSAEPQETPAEAEETEPSEADAPREEAEAEAAAPVEEAPEVPQLTESGQATVLLAEVTDDLDNLREGTRRYLEQAGFQVVPRSPYRLDPAAFQEALDRDLESADLFVQLLSGLPGKRPEGLPQGYLALQAERAGESGTPILQWRDRKLTLDSIEDEAHRKLLEGPSVISTHLEEFKAEVLRHLEKAEDEATTPLNAFVFVNAEQEDSEIADAVCEALDERGITWARPLDEGRPAAIRQGLQRHLMACDALIVINGKTPNSWVEEQLRFLRKHLHQRQKPLEILSLLDGPTDDEQPLGFNLPNMTSLDCRQGVSKDAIRVFLDEVRENLDSE